LSSDAEEGEANEEGEESEDDDELRGTDQGEATYDEEEEVPAAMLRSASRAQPPPPQVAALTRANSSAQTIGTSPFNESDNITTTKKDYNILIPHAKFFVKREKSRCSINFDPPV
jgi:hypothetical protein